MKALSFEGNGLEYFKIWIVNILLVIVTIGLYYPWAKVRNNRYLYANTTLENRTFDYHATGKQLFVGYLIAMALLIVYVIIQNVSPTGGAIVFLIFIAALPWIIWRSLKFNMRITSFSNVRFGFDGKLGGAYFNYLLLPILFFLALYSAPLIAAIVFSFVGDSIGLISGVLLTAVTIAGIVLAIYMFGLLKKRNTSYVINASRYGQGHFSTNLKTSEFVKISLKTAGLFIAGLFAYMIVVGIVAFVTGASDSLLSLQSNLEDPEAIQEVMEGGALVFVAVIYIGIIALSLLVFSYSFSRQRAYIFANSTLDKKIKLASTLRARPLAWISVTNFLAIVFTLGLAVPWATVRLTRFVLEHTEVDTSVGFEEYVTQQQKEQSSLGEQIGDAFDVDVGLGF